MRHRVGNKRLSRNIAERKALMRSLARNIMGRYRIRTTLVKAKEARRHIERLITLGKENTVHARREAYKVLNDRGLVKTLFTELAPLFKDRTGGYTRIIKDYPRRGDGAEMVFLELTEQPVKEVKKPRKKIKEKEAGEPEKKPEKKPDKKADKKAEKKEEKKSPAPAPETKAAPPKKGFFKDLRQYFKRKSMG